MNLKTKNQRIVKYGIPVCTAVCLSLVGDRAGAEGFRNATMGTSDLGRSGGRIAQVDDVTAVQHNPANLVGVTNFTVSITPSVIYINVDYQSPAGLTASTIHPWKMIPNVFAAMPLIKDKLVAGLGVSVPYGLANQWSSSSGAFNQPNGNLAYTAPNYSQLLTININPTLAYKVNDSLQVGAGLDIMYSDLQFDQFLSPLVPNLQARIDGSGVGEGGNLGITWLVTDRQTLSLTYRSTMTVDYSGNARFEYFPGTPSSSFQSQIKYPNIIAAGYGIKLTDKIRLESDFEWLQFSQFKNLPIRLGANPVGVPSQSIAEDWHNTFTAGLGGDWQFADHWILRGSYQYFKTPVPDSTFSPTIPDANQNVVTVGLGWKHGNTTLEASYGLDFYNDRNITHDQVAAYDGKYTFNVHLISVALNHSF